MTAGVALWVDDGGVVDRIEHDPDGLLPVDLPVRPLAGVVPDEQRRGLFMLIGGAFERGVSDSLQLDLWGTDGAIRSLVLVGARLGGQVLILGQPEQTSRLRAAARETAQLRAGPPSEELLGEFTALNNELAAMQRELAQSNARLLALSEQKSQLLGMAAHDLRNPLAAITGYAAFVLLEPDLPEQARSFVASIRERSEFMAGLVSDLVDVTALESGRVDMRCESLDILEHVRAVVAREAVVGARKDIDLVLEAEGEPGTIRADASKLEQVLVNLVSNAIKFSHRGSRVAVRLVGDPDEVRFEVADQGQGIPASEQASIFAPFAKTSVRGTEGEKSTGLGLAIVARLVKAHGGSISVRSTAGEGTTFAVRLPRDEPPVVPAPPGGAGISERLADTLRRCSAHRSRGPISSSSECVLPPWPSWRHVRATAPQTRRPPPRTWAPIRQCPRAPARPSPV